MSSLGREFLYNLNNSCPPYAFKSFCETLYQSSISCIFNLVAISFKNNRCWERVPQGSLFGDDCTRDFTLPKNMLKFLRGTILLTHLEEFIKAVMRQLPNRRLKLAFSDFFRQFGTVIGIFRHEENCDWN